MLVLPVKVAPARRKRLTTVASTSERYSAEMGQVIRVSPPSVRAEPGIKVPPKLTPERFGCAGGWRVVCRRKDVLDGDAGALQTSRSIAAIGSTVAAGP